MSKLIEIKNISNVLEDSHLRELFECCGKIETMEMRRDQDGRVCFIEFSTAQEAEAAGMLSGTQLGDLPLKVSQKSEADAAVLMETKKDMQPATAPTPNEDVEKALEKVKEFARLPANKTYMEESRKRDDKLARTIYVGNLNPMVTEEHLRAIFKACGEIDYMKMSAQEKALDPTSQSDVRYAFVEFVTAESAQRAFSLQGTPVGDRPMKIGKATTPIFKPGSLSQEAIMPAAAGMPYPAGTAADPGNSKVTHVVKEVTKGFILTNPVRLSNAMNHVRSALSKLSSTLSRRQKRRKRRRSSSSSRSPTPPRRRRRYSPSRRTPSTNNPRSRFWKRPTARLAKAQAKKSLTTPSCALGTELVWDGFQWHPKDSKEGQVTRDSLNLRIQNTRNLHEGLPQSLQMDGATQPNLPPGMQGGTTLGGQTASELAAAAVADLTRKFGNRR